MRHLLWVLVGVLGGAAAVQVAALVVLRLGRRVLARRRDERRTALRRLLLTALLGEGSAARAAFADLRARRGRGWREVENQALSLLPKIKGDARTTLTALLLERGAVRRARCGLRSRRMVGRAAAAHRLGSLAQPDSTPDLLPLLRDKQFLVRRTAVRALGQLGDPAAVPALLDAVVRDDSLTRDAMGTVQRLGSAAVDPLRAELAPVTGSIDPGVSTGRRAALAATGLGLLADVGSVPLLVRVLGRSRGRLRAATAEALGLIGSPAAVAPLLAILDDDDPTARTTAATALGRIGSAEAAAGLARALDGADRDADRAVAAALLRLERTGREVLATAGSPYAAEALAVHRVRQDA
ncbi:MAG TPA: HEAT repeat domain-containing protein [Nocardioidaceae bacterium]|nr:HEAT repeat domain-containing protein [Nocardioidaceae bacterium]